MASFVTLNRHGRARLGSAPTSIGARLGAGAIAIAVAWAPTALAQNANDPFFDSTVQLSQAIGLERIYQELLVIQTLDRPYPSQLTDVIDGMVGAHFQRFAGTLSNLNADLAVEFFQVLDAIDEGVEQNQLVSLDVIDVVSWVQIAFALLDDTYNLVVPQDVRSDPAFESAIMAQLLLGDGGVADALAGAFVVEWEFTHGWVATQRFKVMWADLRDIATPDQQLEIEDAIAELDAIYPSILPSLEGLEPEGAEDIARRILDLLEAVVDVELYAGRDPIRLADHLTQLAGEGCSHYEAGDDQRGREVMHAVLDHYAGDTTGLGATIGMLAPQAHATAIGALEALVAVDDTRDTGRLVNIRRAINAPAADPVATPDDDADVDEETMGVNEACRLLVDALGEANAVLGG